MHYYFDPRSLRIFVLGIASGLPWVVIGSMLTLWLKDAGLSRSSIGYAGAIYAAYSINFIWSPLIDRIQRPFGINLGQRKSWIVATHLIMVLACLAVATTNPTSNASLTIMLCLIVAIASATQDIAIDAFRIDSIGEDENELMSVGAAMAIAGWWTGYAGIGAVVLLLADSFTLDWPTLYRMIAPALLILTTLVAFFPEPDMQKRQAKQQGVRANYIDVAKRQSSYRKLLALTATASPLVLALWLLSGGAGIADAIKESAWYVPSGLLAGAALLTAGILLIGNNHRMASTLTHPNASLDTNVGKLDYLSAALASAVIAPLAAFFNRNGVKLALGILLFIVLFKIGEAFLGRMSLVFYREIGFSNSDIAYYSKLVSWGVTVVFSLLSGAFVVRFGIVRGLFVAGIAMAASNLMFAVLASLGPIKWLFATTVIIDGFTSAWSNVAFVAFLSSLCDRTYTATQYALLASLGTLGRTFFASSSGQLVDWLQGNWPLFFILTALAVVPSLLILLKLGNRLESESALEPPDNPATT